MNSFYSHSFFRTTMVVAMLVLLAAYLLFVNYHLPYMVADEYRAFTNTVEMQLAKTRMAGRPSHYISHLSTGMLTFYSPTIIQLTPRLLTMVALVLSLFVTLKRFGYSHVTAVGVSVFAIIGHQLDWEHNGLIAFFGGYNLYLVFFIFAIFVYEKYDESWLAYIISFILVILSFTTELFFGLALIYILVTVMVQRSFAMLKNSSIVHACVLYTLFAVVMLSQAEGVNQQEMEEYLVGSLGVHSAIDIGNAALLYFIHSIPFYNKLGFNNQISLLLSASIAIFIVGSALIYTYQRLVGTNQCNLDFKSNIPFLAVLVSMALAPQVLLAMQSMKYEWVVSGASTRYVFSLYTWVSLVLLSAFAIRLLQRPRMARIILVAPMLLFIGYALNANIEFVNSYKESFAKWQEISRLATVSDESVKIPSDLLEHPYISSISKVDIKKFIFNVYGKTALVCMPYNEFNLSGTTPHPLFNFKGFYAAENSGRWTSGDVASIYIKRPLRRGDIIEIDIAGVYGDNNVLPTHIRIGRARTQQVLKPNSILHMTLLDDMDTSVIEIKVPAPVSPNSYQGLSDTRTIGIMVKNVRLRPSKDNNLLTNQTDYCK